MFKNYLKVAVRSILKDKLFSTINILGMATGLAACLFIALYIYDELSFDTFHKDADTMYRIALHGKIAGQEVYTNSSCSPLSAALVSEVAGVEQATRIEQRNGVVFKYEEVAFTESKILYADSNFFQFFSFALTQGDPSTVLVEPNSVVLTEALAKKYFGNENAVGKLMTIGNGNKTYKVTGIAEAPPGNSHITFQALLSTSSEKERFQSNVWVGNFLYTYFRKNPETSVDEINSKLEGLVSKYAAPMLEKFTGTTFQQFRDAGGVYSYYAYPMLDSHLYSSIPDDITPASDIQYVYILLAIGIFILLIACINFMNLSTAKSANRAKEVGLRKTLGSLRSQLAGQFLAESFVYSVVAVLIAIAACYLLMPSFNTLSGKTLETNVLISPVFVIAVCSLILLVGLIAGSYPAFYLTSFSAVEVLKGKVRAGMKSKGVRSVLVVMQFSISVFLITVTLIVTDQLNYMQTKNLGFDKQSIMIIHNATRLNTNMEPFKNALGEQTGIEKVSFTNNSFPGVNNTTVFKEVGSETDHIMGVYFADYDHMDVMKFEMNAGRYFSKDFPSDSTAIILNETAAKEFGWSEPIGQEVIFQDSGNPVKYKVIGVYKDFNFESLKTKVRPLAIMLTGTSNTLLIRYSGNSKEAMATTEKLWKQYASGEPFEFEFMDESFDKLFRAEQRLSNLFSVFSGLAIFIACLGLFALAAFTAEQRTKEIGVRKALGASLPSLTMLLSKEFTRLVLISFVPAFTAAWFMASSWLSGFANRIEISPWIFLWSGVLAIAIAWLTVSYQSIKAATANPVESLRYE
jgi:putative ABC transport system permease protein